MEGVLTTIEFIIWIITALCVAYLFAFSISSLGKNRYPRSLAKKQSRFVVLFPAYGEDSVIEESLNSFLKQEYPRDLYDIVVISDHMTETVNHNLGQMPVTLLIADYENSSKAKALKLAIDHLKGKQYDGVVIMDADNTVDTNFLQKINGAFNAGFLAVQAHRTAKNRNTDIAVLDAMSEEINNSIFRRGHVHLGLSAALAGSGMAFDYTWFRENVSALATPTEDKELEVLLLKQGIFIEYLEDVLVYDEKIKSGKGFYNQRQRWLASQFSQWKLIFHDLPGAILSGNIDYCDKLIQWLMPPRILLMGGTIIMTFLVFIWKWDLSLKWIGILFILCLAICFAIPDWMVDTRFKKAINKTPFLFLMMFANLFRMKAGRKTFIHTPPAERSSN